MSKCIAFEIRTKNDINGNPRRGYQVFEYIETPTGDFWHYLNFVVVSHEGKDTVTKQYPDVIFLPTCIKVDPSYYHECIHDPRNTRVF